MTFTTPASVNEYAATLIDAELQGTRLRFLRDREQFLTG